MLNIFMIIFRVKKHMYIYYLLHYTFSERKCECMLTLVGGEGHQAEAIREKCRSNLIPAWGLPYSLLKAKYV